MHCGTNGVSVKGLRRGLNTNKCDTSHLLPCQSWNWSYLRSVPSINLHSHIRPLCELRTNCLQAPRAHTVKPEEYRLLLEKGHSPGESSEAVSLCLQRVRGPDPLAPAEPEEYRLLLEKGHSPGESSEAVKTKKGGPAQAIVCHFCLYACSNDDYAYRHLAAIHLNIQWGCGTCYGYVSGYLSKIREHVQSPPEEELQRAVPTHYIR